MNLHTRRLLNLLQTFGPLAALILLLTLGGLFRPSFVTPTNLLLILQNASYIGIIAVGLTFIIILGGIDLSVGSLLALAAAVGVWVMNTALAAKPILAGDPVGFKLNPPYTHAQTAFAHFFTSTGLAGRELPAVLIAILVILAVASFAGAVHGFLVTFGRIAPFIATLAGLVAYRSLALYLADGLNINSVSDRFFPVLGDRGIPLPFLKSHYGQPLTLYYSILVFLLIAALGQVLLSRTRYGRYVRAIGCNERAALYSAVNVQRVKILTYALVGLCTGIAAVLYASNRGSVSSSQAGLYWELDAIAAVVVGGASMRGGRGSVYGALIGTLLIIALGNLLTHLQVSDKLQGLVKGLIILAAVLLSRPSAPSPSSGGGRGMG